MGIFHGYFDESGKVDKPVVAFCGLIAPLSKIQPFEDEWNGILRSYGMNCLTMKRAFKSHVPLSPVIRKQTFTERIDSLKPFADCIRKHFEFGSATAVDVEAFKKLSPVGKKKLQGVNNPHYMAFLTAMIATAEHLLPADKLSLICDDDEQTAWDCYRFYRRVRKIRPICNERLISLAFAEDSSFPALQAADLLSALTRMRARFQFFRTPYDYAPLFDYLTAPQPLFKWGVKFFDKSALEKFGSS